MHAIINKLINKQNVVVTADPYTMFDGNRPGFPL